jgi:lysophospholipase L1-like esterase
MLFEPRTKLVMIGDSITDCGRALPIGEVKGEGLGNGYVSLVNALLTSTYPRQQVRVVNTGVGGNTVLDLAERWQSDVLDLQPDWLSVMIGINDVWRQFDSPLQIERHVSLEKYTATLDALLRKTRPALKGLIMMTPYLIEPNRGEPMRAMMDKYGVVVRTLAEKHQAVFVDTQAAFDVVMKDVHPMTLAQDRVHPGLVGHAILARAFLNAIGYEW